MKMYKCVGFLYLKSVYYNIKNGGEEMRIGLFTDTYLPYVSGLVTSEVMLKESLEKMGHEVFVVTMNLENLKFRVGNISDYSGEKNPDIVMACCGDTPTIEALV